MGHPPISVFSGFQEAVLRTDTPARKSWLLGIQSRTGSWLQSVFLLQRRKDRFQRGKGKMKTGILGGGLAKMKDKTA